MIIKTPAEFFVNIALFDYVEGAFNATTDLYKLIAVRLDPTPVFVDLTAGVSQRQFLFYEQTYITAVVANLPYLDFSEPTDV